MANEARLIGGNKWERVNSYHTGAERVSPHKITVKKFFETNGQFQSACEVAGVKVTRRQASKWLNGKGSAYANRGSVVR